MGTIKLVTGLSKTVTFLKSLGCLYDTFGIHEKGSPAIKVTLRVAKENVDKVCSEVQRTVASVKRRFNLSSLRADVYRRHLHADYNLSRETNGQRVQFPRKPKILSPCYAKE